MHCSGRPGTLNKPAVASFSLTCHSGVCVYVCIYCYVIKSMGQTQGDEDYERGAGAMGVKEMRFSLYIVSACVSRDNS